MQYIQPVGAQGSDNAFGKNYVDKNAGAGIAGSFLPAAVPTNLQLEILNAIFGAGIAPSGADMQQLLKAVRSQRMNFVAAAAVGGTANAIALTFSPTFAADGDLLGVPLRFIVEAAPTGNVTLQVDALAAAPLRFPDGTQFGAGTLSVGQMIEVVFDGTSFRAMGGWGGRWGTITGNLPDQYDLWAALQQASQSYPTVNGATGLITTAIGTGTIEVSNGNTISNRFSSILSANIPIGERQFVTFPSKTYHLRFVWPGTSALTPIATYPNGRFFLYDLADPVYNPGSLAETNTVFDSTPNNALLARVTTDGSNILTVTALLNTFQLFSLAQRATPTQHASEQADVGFTLNWSRRPTTVNWRQMKAEFPGSAVGIYKANATVTSRYSVSIGTHAYDPALAAGSRFIFGAFEVELFA